MTEQYFVIEIIPHMYLKPLDEDNDHEFWEDINTPMFEQDFVFPLVTLTTDLVAAYICAGPEDLVAHSVLNEFSEARLIPITFAKSKSLGFVNSSEDGSN